MTFQETVRYFESIKTPAQRQGIFDVNVIFKNGRKLHFEQIKLNANPSSRLGFGLNHYNYFYSMKPNKFFDGEDASVNLDENEFISSEVDGNQITIITRTFKLCVTISTK